jgi:CelD/BcsL family acetyltransferase involved in cellulose biosynthesis
LISIEDQCAEMIGKVIDRDFSAKYKAELVTWEAGLSILNIEGKDAVGGPFQSVGWLRAWNDTIGRSAGWPFMIVVRERSDDNLATMLPLLLRRADQCQMCRILAWADCGVSDYNAPILGASAPTDAAGADAMWRAVKRVLPVADLVKFTKMPITVEGRRNPLTLLREARASSVHGHTLVIGSTWDSYLEGLKRPFLRELRRSWKVFMRHETAAFVFAESDDEARRVFVALESLQRKRFESNNLYSLDRPELKSFYRKLVPNGIRNGEVMLSALTCRGEVVAALLGLVSWPRYVMIRVSADYARWGHCSPGRLIFTETIRQLHEQGFTIFDFSVGEHAYKRRLGVKSEALFELISPISSVGLLAWTAYRALKRYPRLESIARAYLKAKPN